MASSAPSAIDPRRLTAPRLARLHQHQQLAGTKPQLMKKASSSGTVKSRGDITSGGARRMHRTVSDPKKSLVLVLGAGASFEAGLPLGIDLKRQIADALLFKMDGFGRLDHNSGDDRILHAMKSLANYPAAGAEEMNRLLQCARHICDAMPLALSIDNFIDSHREEPRIAMCGKLAIARCILEAEKKSILFVDRTNVYNSLDFEAADKTWLTPFFRLLTENCQKKDIEARLHRVGIISFNYDRTIEHFLFHALQRYYRESAGWASKTVKALDIHHPYGKVGSLPWIDRQQSIDFGETPEVQQLIQLSKQLLTFSEGTNADKGSIDLIRRDIANAKRLAFLGFAFHPLNMEVLFGGSQWDLQTNSRPVLGTALKVSPSDVEVIAKAIRHLSKRELDMPVLRDLTCSALFHEYQRSLSLAGSS
jgi:hypothetical protein